MDIYKEGADYKGKNPYYARLDKILTGYAKKYTAGKLSRSAYFAMCVDIFKTAWSPWDI